MALADDLERIATTAADRANGDGSSVSGVLAAEPAPGRRVYVCAFETEAGARTWLALDDEGAPVTSQRDVRDAVSIAALCEVAEESAFPGDLDELRAQLVALRITESPDGIDEAEDAARALQHVIGAPPHLASPARLDAIGQAVRRLELAPVGGLDVGPKRVGDLGRTTHRRRERGGHRGIEGELDYP